MARLRYVQTFIAADLLGITTAEVRRLIAGGELRAIKKGHRWFFVSMDDVTELHHKSGEPPGELTVEPVGELTIDQVPNPQLSGPGPPGKMYLVGNSFKRFRRKSRRRKTKDYLNVKTTE